jgi:hypothetical protein
VRHVFLGLVMTLGEFPKDADGSYADGSYADGCMEAVHAFAESLLSLPSKTTSVSIRAPLLFHPLQDPTVQ